MKDLLQKLLTPFYPGMYNNIKVLHNWILFCRRAAPPALNNNFSFVDWCGFLLSVIPGKELAP